MLSAVVIDLGTLGGASSQANDINASSQVVGRADLANGRQHAFLWQQGVMTDLGSLGGQYSSAFAINDAGQIVGESYASSSNNPHAFLIMPEDADGNGAPDRWYRDTNGDGKNDLMLDLGTLGGNISSANDVNNAGQVVGSSVLGDGRTHAFRWQNGVMSDLGTLGGPDSSALAINDAGQMTGWAMTAAGDMRAFLRNGGVMTDLSAGAWSSAVDINAAGQVAGYAHPFGVASAHLWTPTVPNGSTGTFRYLGYLPGDEASAPSGVNDAGHVVGYSATHFYDESGDYWVNRPFLFTDGSMQDLNTLLAPGSDWSLSDATAINDAEQIVGSGSVWNPATGQAQSHAFLMTSVSLGLPLLTIDDVTVTEGNSGTSNAVFTVSLSEASTQTVTVNYATYNGSATAGADYLATSGALTFAPGQLSRTISVPVIGERVIEPVGQEYFYVALNSPGNSVVADASGTGIIKDDEPRIFSVGTMAVEGNSGTTPAIFNVSLSNAYDQTVTVDYNTSDYTAISGSDYLPTSGRLTFAPGEISKQVTVPIVGDRTPEVYFDEYAGFIDDFEAFYLNISASSNAYVGSTGMGLIVDNEPRITANAVTVVEGNSGTVSAVVTVSLSNAYDQTVTIDYTTATGSAVAGSDYSPMSGSLSFAPGETSKSVPLTVLGDRLGESGESFALNLANASSFAFVKGHGSVTIADDEPDVYLTPYYYTETTEGNSGATPLVFTINLTTPYDQPVIVSYTTADIGSAVAGSDYFAASGSVTFAAGETSKTFVVSVIGDAVYEYDEYFQAYLTSTTANASFYSLEYSDVYIINDDPVVPVLWISGVTDSEGNTGTRTFSFIVSLSEASSQIVTVSYATASGTAAAGSDYRTIAGTVTFAPGETYKTISVSVNGDRLPEADETFFVNLASPTNAIIADGQGFGIGTILDDEPRINIGDVSKAEGKKGKTTLFTFTVTLSVAYDQAVTMSFRTVNGTATTDDNDYIARTGTLTFAPGETTKTITIEVKGDSKRESNEIFYLDLLGNSNNSLLNKKRAVGTILNDD